MAMSKWYRVFGASNAAVEPAALLEHLRGLGFELRPLFRGDDLGWFHADLAFEEGEPPIALDRYLVREEGIRGELNSWAAWLETVEGNPHAPRLMEHVIRTEQLFTLEQPLAEDGDALAEDVCRAACRFLARATNGVCQEDGQGFFDENGVLLVREG
jgi:hypothetical protein